MIVMDEDKLKDYSMKLVTEVLSKTTTGKKYFIDNIDILSINDSETYTHAVYIRLTTEKNKNINYMTNIVLKV